MRQKLSVGNKAPDFVGLTHTGQKVKLSDFEGKPVWLIFYRYPGCPLCNLHISMLRLRYEAAEKHGLEIVAVFESSVEGFPKDMKYPSHPKFTMVADEKKKIYDAYYTESRLSGVVRPSVAVGFLKAMFSGFRQGKVEGTLGQIPAHFLISEDGVIENMHYGRHIDDHIAWNKVDDFLNVRRPTQTAKSI